jgi:hypothetical protein
MESIVLLLSSWQYAMSCSFFSDSRKTEFVPVGAGSHQHSIVLSHKKLLIMTNRWTFLIAAIYIKSIGSYRGLIIGYVEMVAQRHSQVKKR